MKGAIFHGPHQPLTIEEIKIDTPMAREIVVRTAATGVWAWAKEHWKGIL